MYHIISEMPCITFLDYCLGIFLYCCRSPFSLKSNKLQLYYMQQGSEIALCCIPI